LPRITRGLTGGFVYHVFNHGNGRQKIFRTEEDYQFFLELMAKASQIYPVKVFAYCLMPNHFHVVLRPEETGVLSRWVHWLLTSHVHHHHQIHKTKGHLWRNRFRAFIVQEDLHFLSVIRFVEGNPVRRGLVESADQWPWSSHLENIGRKEKRIVCPCPGELPPFWAEFVNSPILHAELIRLQECEARQSPYGDPVWQFEICRKLGLESTIRPRGRPRKKRNGNGNGNEGNGGTLEGSYD
jgi:putative transposase